MSWKHIELSEQELRDLVRDVYDGKIFTSLHCPNDWQSCFLVSFFIGAKPSFPSPTGNIKVDRKNKLNHIEDCLKYEEETEIREDYINNIGMFYEYLSEAGPRCINGFPMFFSCKILSKSDTNRFRELYRKYVKVREHFDNEWEKMM